MALSCALEAICPTGPHDCGDVRETMCLITTDGYAVRCLEGLLRARCPKGPEGQEAAAGEESAPQISARYVDLIRFYANDNDLMIYHLIKLMLQDRMPTP